MNLYDLYKINGNWSRPTKRDEILFIYDGFGKFVVKGPAEDMASLIGWGEFTVLNFENNKVWLKDPDPPAIPQTEHD